MNRQHENDRDLRNLLSALNKELAFAVDEDEIEWLEEEIADVRRQIRYGL